MSSFFIRKMWPALLPVAVAALCTGQADASLTVLVGEPYGSFGTMMPHGHTALYLDHLCADGPLKLRNCLAGEPEGVVLARYYRIGQTDWIATPVMEFLYASETPDQVPRFVTPELASDLRQRYRQRYMADIVPDGTERQKAVDEWSETAGAAFDRRIWGYQLDTTAEQDQAFMQVINADPNRRRYHLSKTNCADFTAEMVNLYFPGSVPHAERMVDMALMTPKHVSKSVYQFGQRAPELHMRLIEITQVPGTLRRSRPVRGGIESLIKTKRYLFTLVVIQPEVPLVAALLYSAHGRWSMDQGAQVVGPSAFAHLAAPAPDTYSAPGSSVGSQ